MTVPYELIYSFTGTILNLDKSIRWVCIANQKGILVNERSRKGLVPFLSEEENEEYASNAISRQKTRLKFEPKIGKLIYAFGKYEKVNRVTLPINEEYFLLLTMETEENDFDRIIMEKIIPIIDQTKGKFVNT